ncbi:hypothetical protein AB4Y96_09390 [Phyllobacterium sp. TAF24]|uniref:hypothetical protein n=1 Tax=Phyllobacterium sp. TAF24 TaxID=3233068 RepID=UPI003F97C415
MSKQDENAPSVESIEEMVAPSEPAIILVDEAEEAYALIEFYKTRVVILRAALRREQQVTKDLTDKLDLANKGLEEVRGEIAELSRATPVEKTGKAH